MHLENMGAIDVVFTTDSDVILLGVKRVVLELKPDKKMLVVNRAAALALPELGAGAWTDYDLITYGVLNGCDYCGKPLGHGEKFIQKFHAQMKTLTPTQIDSALAEFESKTFGEKWGGGSCSAYRQLFNIAVSSFMYAPIFQFTTAGDPKALLANASATVEISPIRPLPTGWSLHDWYGSLGFWIGYRIPVLYNTPRRVLADYFRGSVWARSHLPLRPLEQPTH